MLLNVQKISATILITKVFVSIAMGQGGDPEVRELINTWQNHYEASIENIDDYVVVMDHQTVYYKKAYDNGRPYFRSRVEGADERELVSGSNLTDAEVFSRVYDAVLEKAVYKGSDRVNGHDVHVLYLDKLEGLVEEPWAPQRFEDVYLRIDPEKWVVRELELKARILHEGEERVINQVIQERDYRTVEGMQIPYETIVITKGLALTEEERREAKEGIAQAERELEAMPEAQRRMIEQMMGDRLEKYKQMLEDDVFETVYRVEEVRVNTGTENF